MGLSVCVFSDIRDKKKTGFFHYKFLNDVNSDIWRSIFRETIVYTIKGKPLTQREKTFIVAKYSQSL